MLLEVAMNASKEALIAGALFVVMAVMIGCERAPSGRVGTTVTTAAHGPRMILNDDAAMILTKARCLRENACNEVGPARRFADRDACKRSFFDASLATVEPAACPAGVNESKLSHCLDDLRSERCEDIHASRAEPKSCRRSELCASR